MGKLKCPKKDREVFVNRSCFRCAYLQSSTVYIPLIESPEYKNYIKKLEDLR